MSLIFNITSFLVHALFLSMPVFLKLFSISAPLNNLLTFKRPLSQKVKTCVFNIYLSNVISNWVAFNEIDEAGVLFVNFRFQLSKEQSQVFTLDYFKTISLAVQKPYHHTKCMLYQV